MAIRRARSGQPPTIPPESEVVSPDVERSHPDSFLYKLMLEVRERQGAVNQTLAHLTETVDKQSQQMGKIDDLRVELARLSTEISHLGREMTSTKRKLDTVRIWIAGAAGIVALIVVLAPVVINKLWSSPGPAGSVVPQVERIQPPRR